MYNPVSTYRVQFHKGFNFRQFEQVIPYLTRLGIKTIYASPIFKATAGSMHGYDVTDPLTINPEIGTLDELRTISKKLKKLGIGWLQDIVPNHMAFHPDNNWLMDVLKKGRRSPYASYFDILWDVPGQNGKLMVPFLGNSFDEALAAGEITINNAHQLSYMGQNYPLNLNAKTSRGNITDPQLIREIADAQHYRMCSWKETNEHINYRRFFTVNGLICLNMQDKEVFDHYHRLIGKLLTEGVFQGLRVDHIDGLYDPETYLSRLRVLAKDDAYIITEKILETGEGFPAWPVQGNTGYDMLSLINNLFTNKKSKKKLTDFYKSLHTGNTPVADRAAAKKRMILTNYMQGELENLYRQFLSLDVEPAQRPLKELKEAIGELMIAFPVYRLYGNTYPLPAAEAEIFDDLLEQVKLAKPHLAEAIAIIENAFSEGMGPLQLEFYQRLMQFTGPLMAKGVEDTLMYTYNRFIAHNEVGDSPAAFGIKTKAFHSIMQARLEEWPLSMTATATHDTKRGEDVRARLNALSDMSVDWIANVKQWQKSNVKLKANDYPDNNDEYFIYQTIVGCLPMPGQPDDDFSGRLNEYLVKALREGKANSDWAKPNEDYENRVKDFATVVTGQINSSPFFKQLADYGIINSLAQVLLKYTMPGIPDLYQGCESWDLSFVDPDNRRPVNYAGHAKLLTDVETPENLWSVRYDGRIKQQLTRILLQQRAEHAGLFTSGDYIALRVKGKNKKNICAYARNSGNTWFVTVIPLHQATLVDDDWDDTKIILPDLAPPNWKNLLNNKKGHAVNAILVKQAFGDMPLGLLRLTANDTSRSAGILMHITSLPSDFGIGDMGPAAYAFADLLSASGQKYWQLLPVNPVDKSTDYSPYSATSAMAGNTMLISPGCLVKVGWIDKAGIEVYYLPQTGRANLEQAEINKNLIFSKAYKNFIAAKDTELTEEFTLFKKSEDNWLTGTDKEKWLQWVFATQWNKLKSYCNDKNIKLVGDLPFYMGFHSVDVKAHPELFKQEGIAGVPPDYFSANGQLWGMPVHNWQAHKTQHYRWWIERIKKNLAYFDIIRLDHFRAFSAYWEVPAGNDTAINGSWQPGPGIDLFEQLKQSIGYLPFIAEDLGNITDDVYRLRDKFNLPGMRVLQFAFDEALAISPHIPHNYTANSVAYTGTHDNNTARGWFTNDADKATRQRIAEYARCKVQKENIHKVLIRMLYASVADIVIVPLQDVLGLDESAKMNDPTEASGNWRWQLQDGMLTHKVEKYLRGLVTKYNR